MVESSKRKRAVVGLFAGIGGFELGFEKAGFRNALLCEIDPVAQRVLSNRFPDVEVVPDVRDISNLPTETEVLCAGFPCQDLSSIGAKKGMAGTRSSLVKEVFRILERNRVEWVVFENVPFMLILNNAETIRAIGSELTRLGYKWAYRQIDSGVFVPQKRERVYVVASLHHDPRSVILRGNSKGPQSIDYAAFSAPIGFYWTEGKYALGMKADGIPTLKAGSTIGIPSPPAILFPNGIVATPDIRDAERLQGFPPDWTKAAEEIARPSFRWRLVGNAVTVNTIRWLANGIANPVPFSEKLDSVSIPKNATVWPKSAFNVTGLNESVERSPWPVSRRRPSISTFLRYPVKPLSHKAVSGFLSRLRAGNLRHPSYFETALENFKRNLENNDEPQK